MHMPVDDLSPVITVLMYFGDIVFAVSGALAAAHNRMDVLGIVLIGIVTGIGGGTMRDILLGHAVWWVQNPDELVLCAVAAFATYFVRRIDLAHADAAVWADALGLAAFSVTGVHVALHAGAPIIVAAFLGMLTATGGGVIRDLLTGTRPMILTGEIYATAALAGAASCAALWRYGLSGPLADFTAFAIAFAIRGAAILFRVRLGVAGEPMIVTKRRAS